MQWMLIALGLVLVAVGLWFAVNGMGDGPSAGGWRGLKLEAPAWLFLVFCGVVLIVFSATHSWPRAEATATDGSVLDSIGTGPPDTTPGGPTTGSSTTLVVDGQTSSTPAESTTASATSSSRPPTTPATDPPTSPSTDPPTTPSSKPPTPPSSKPPTTPTIPTTAPPPPLRDCLPYDPTKLRIEDERATGWLLTDGRSRMVVLDNGTDAKAALAVAQRHTSHCFIGRNNTRANRATYIAEFWLGGSGQTTTVASPDCIAYNPSRLSITDEGAGGWLLSDGASRMLVLDNRTDAEEALAAAKTWTSQCFIGRGNKRPDRLQYIVEYWQ